MPLIDYPRSGGIDTDAKLVAVCDEVCVEMNAYAAVALSQMAALASKLQLTNIAATYADRAETIRSAANATFFVPSDDCVPARVGPCFSDQPVIGTSSTPAFNTSAPATALAAFAEIPGSAIGVLKLVPFLRARNARRGPSHGLEISGWLAGFMLKAVYAAAGELNQGGWCCLAHYFSWQDENETLINVPSWSGVLSQISPSLWPPMRLCLRLNALFMRATIRGMAE